MNRRNVFLLGLTGIAGLVGLRLAISSDEDAITDVLRKRLAHLLLDEQGLKTFARDLASKHKVASSRLLLVSAAAPIYSRISFDGQSALSHSIRHGEERIVTDYLLSTDFFINGADESRLIRYLGYFDPMKACANPFARRLV
jgi:hypothetical protein